MSPPRRRARSRLAVAGGVAVLGAAGVWLAAPARVPEPRTETGGNAVALLSPPVPVPEHAERRPRLALVSTSVADDPARSHATLLDPEADRYEVVRPGERLARHPEIEVAAVGVRWVELVDGAGAWRLQLASEAARRGPGPGALQRILGAPGLTQSERIHLLVDADTGERTSANLLSEASFAPVYDEAGMLAGLLLTSVQASGVYDRLGLAAGDRLLEVNGIRLDGDAAMEEALRALEAASSLHLLVDSGGEPRRLLVDVAPSRSRSAL